MRYIEPMQVVRQHLKDNPAPTWKVAVMCFHSQSKTSYIAEQFHAELLGYRVLSKCDEKTVYQAEISGVHIGILGWCTGGGPMVASLIEELSAIGVQYIIGIGAAASISTDLLINEIILATKLLVNDGTSKCYINDRDVVYIDHQMRKIFKDAARELSIDVKDVMAATVDALYRQDDNMLKPWQEKGCQIVNWELTPFYVVSEICKIKSLWFGHISDIELDGKWKDWYCDRKQSFEECVRLCKEIVLHLIRNIIYEN